jgi:methylglutaconyl-CoA hydratase
MWSVATPDARFAFSEVKLGLIPAVIAPYVVRKIGYGNARALFHHGRTVRRRDRAADWAGASSSRLPTNWTRRWRRSWGTCCRTVPNAMAAAKMLLHATQTLPADELRSLTIARIAELRVSPEGQEGIRAFLEKRTPNFGGTA